MAHILLVDDEPNILNALRRELEAEHEVETFTSPQEALQRASTTDFDLVLTDYRMPEMDGVAFLEILAQRQPDTMRLILSGQADVEALIKAINVSHPYLFVPKPWDRHDLKAGIAQALNFRQATLENRRLAAACQNDEAFFPGKEQKRYRILLATSEANDAIKMKSALSDSVSREEMHGRNPCGMHGCFLCKEEDLHSMVSCFTTRQQVLEHLKNEAYDLLIVDFLLLEEGRPGFLEEVRKLSPDSAFMLLGGNVDMDTLAGAINRISVDDFISRPWNACELKCMVLRALHYRDLRRENQRLANLFRQKGNPP